jgi:hypothetical protein
MIFDKLLQHIESEDIILFYNKIFNLTYTLYDTDKASYVNTVLNNLSRCGLAKQIFNTYNGNFYKDTCNFFYSHKDCIDFNKMYTQKMKDTLNEYLFVRPYVYQEKDLFLTSLKFQKYSSSTLEQIFNVSAFTEEEETLFWTNVVKYQQLSVEFIQKFYVNKINTPKLAYFLKTSPNQFFSCSDDVIRFILNLAKQYEINI